MTPADPHSVFSSLSFRALLVPPMFLVSTGCKEEIPDVMQDPTETGAIQGDDIDTDTAGSDESADETGSTPVPECIFNDNDELENAFVHQCSAQYILSVDFIRDPTATGPVSDQANSATISTVSSESTYEKPFVAACCTDLAEHPFWDGGNSCGLIHQKACYADLIDHICHTIHPLLLDKSADLQVAAGIGGGSVALQNAAGWFELNADKCSSFFWENSPIGLPSADYCAFSGGVDHGTWDPGDGPDSTTITGAKVSDFEISLTTIVNEPGVLTLPASPTDCSTPPDNDNNLPDFFQVGPGTVVRDIVNCCGTELVAQRDQAASSSVRSC